MRHRKKMSSASSGRGARQDRTPGTDESFSVLRGKNGIMLAGWNGRRVVCGSKIRIAGNGYSLSDIWTTEPLAENVLLPTRALPYGSTAQLIDGLCNFFSGHGGLDGDEIVLLASFTLATWFSDIGKYCPSLSIICPDYQAGANLLVMLGCVCRHPVHLFETTEKQILSLPFELFPTVLLRQAKPNASLQRTLRGMSRSESLIFRDGKTRDISAPLVFCSDEPVFNGFLNALEIAVLAGSSAIKTDSMYQAAYEFQGKLLFYRLTNYNAVKRSILNVPKVDSPHPELAHVLEGAIVDHDHFRVRILDVLKRRDGDSSKRAINPLTAVVIEATLALSHEESRDEAYAGEIAACANLLLKARNENIHLEPRAVGDLLRKVGVFTEELGSAGRGIKLMVATRRQIHQLALAHEVAAALDGIVRCSLCAEASPTAVSKWTS